MEMRLQLVFEYLEVVYLHVSDIPLSRQVLDLMERLIGPWNGVMLGDVYVVTKDLALLVSCSYLVPFESISQIRHYFT